MQTVRWREPPSLSPVSHVSCPRPSQHPGPVSALILAGQVLRVSLQVDSVRKACARALSLPEVITRVHMGDTCELRVPPPKVGDADMLSGQSS